MATFNYTVDTEPMAKEIDTMSHHVNLTTGAVVAMQSAVILAEENSANHICNNVNKGFYSLIYSQISQKMAKLQSEVDAHIMQLNQQKRALLGIQNRMQKDYHMISSRYLKFFNGINANLRQRIFELDKPTFDFAMKEMEKLSNRNKNLAATVPITQTESLSQSQNIIASNVKNKSFRAIHLINRFLTENNEQNDLINTIVVNEKIPLNQSEIYLPVVISESTSDGFGNKKTEVFLPENFNADCKTKIFNQTFQNLDKIEIKEDTENNEVKNYFLKNNAESPKSERVKEMTMKLFKDNLTKTF